VSEEIIVAGWMEYAHEERDTMLGHLVEVQERTLETEPGCLDYAISADPTDAGRIRVFERWVCQQALDEHFATPHIKDFRTAVAGLTRVGVCLHVHSVAETRTMR
jgi:quinol monooxygenase YgiN